MIMMKQVSASNGTEELLAVLTAILHGIDTNISESSARNKVLELFNASDRQLSYHNINMSVEETYVVFQY